jgi:hypothetical protein
MPVCQDCGNTESFVHRIRGTETRLYVESGEIDKVEEQSIESTECWCAECESHNVVFDADPENESGTSTSSRT